jgi:hypothetical protein
MAQKVKSSETGELETQPAPKARKSDELKTCECGCSSGRLVEQRIEEHTRYR